MDQLGAKRPEDPFVGSDYGFSAGLYLPLAIGVILFLFVMVKLALRALDQFNPNPNRRPAPAPVRRRPQATGRSGEDADPAQGRREQSGRNNQNDADTLRQRRTEQNRSQQQRLPAEIDRDSDDSGSDYDENDPESVLSQAQRKYGNSSKKIGTKKLRKLEEKAERRRMNEIMQREREERRERERAEAEERREQDEVARREENERRETEARQKAERERQEEEEYARLRAQFAVDESGQLELEGDAAENKLAEFIDYIVKRKVCMLDELANRFSMRSVTDAVDRIQQLIANGRLSGILDDRGKFIYVSTEEYEAAARLVRQAGRISIAELTEQLGRVIKLRPDEESDVENDQGDDDVAEDEMNNVEDISQSTAASITVR